MFKTSTTINTLSELKNPEKIIGLHSRVKLSLNIHGIFNLPDELKLKNQFNIPYDFQLYILGNNIQGGQFIQRNATEKELEKLRENLPKAKWKDLDLTLLEPQLNLIDGYNSAKYQQLEDVNFFPQVKFQQKHNEFEFVQDRLVKLEETICDHKKTKIWLLAIPQIQQQEVFKQLQKLKDVSQFQFFETQIFEGFIKFDKMIQNDAMTLQERIFLNSKNSNYIKSKDRLYVNLDLKFDFLFSSAMKRKFQYQLKLLVDQIFCKQIDYQGNIKKKFYNLLQKYFSLIKNDIQDDLQIENSQDVNNVQNKENFINQKKTSLLNLLSKKKSDINELQEEFKQQIQQYIQQCIKIVDEETNNELHRDEIYKQCQNYFKDLYMQYIKKQKVLFRIENKITINNDSNEDNEQMKAQKKTIENLEEQIQSFFVYQHLEMQKFQDIQLESILNCQQENEQIKQLIFIHNINKKKFDLVTMDIVKMIRDNTQNFEWQFLLTLLFYQQKKLKETVLMIKYLKESYSQQQIKINYLILILLKEFSDNENTNKLIEAKNFRLAESEDDKMKNFQRIFFDLFDDGDMTQQIQLEQVINYKQKITKTQQEPLDEQIIQEQKLQHTAEIEEKLQQQLKEIIELCLKYNIKDIAIQFTKLVQKKDRQYYIYKYEIKKQSNQQNSILKSLENILLNNQDPEYIIEGLIQLERFGLLCDTVSEEMIEKVVTQYDDLKWKSKLKFLVFYGQYLSKQEDQNDCIEIYDFAISQFPKISYFWQCLGKCYYKLSDYQKARMYFEQANLLFPYDDQNLILFYMCSDELGEEQSFLIKILKEIKNVKLSKNEESEAFLQHLKKKNLTFYKFLLKETEKQKQGDFLLQQLIK